MTGPAVDLAAVAALQKPRADEPGREDPDEETFIERTRRVHEATQRRKPRGLYARGLDTVPSEFA